MNMRQLDCTTQLHMTDACHVILLILEFLEGDDVLNAKLPNQHMDINKFRNII